MNYQEKSQWNKGKTAENKLKIIVKKIKKKVLTKGGRGDIIAELSQGSKKLNGQHGTLKTV